MDDTEKQLRLEELRKQQEVWLEEHGFYTHFVWDDKQSPTGMNIHTHGLAEKFDHPDLQIVLPMDGHQANSILHAMVDQIKTGGTFVPDKEYAGVMKEPYTVHVKEATECGRRVMRVMLPDVNNKHQDSPVADFRKQWD